MCGICGYVGTGLTVSLDPMLSRLIPRGPDEEGRHIEPGIGLGVRRLRVIDPEGGHQPMSNETCPFDKLRAGPERGRRTGTVWVVLNGEIYNYRELREELIQKGHRFTTNCDTEVLVHLYEQEGEDGVDRLRGMFAYALWDRERRSLLLVRDRLGIKPLYYAVQDGGLVFASELPALLASGISPSIRPQAIAQYLNLLYVPGPGTIFDGIQQLLPGEMLTVDRGRIQRRRYFTPQSLWHESQGDSFTPHASRLTPHALPLTLHELRERFLDLLRETVQSHLVSDVPLGLFLSGGLDSGAILAMMRAVTPGSIRTFSIGYDAEADRTYNELDTARLMADHFGAEHTEARLRPDAVKLLPLIVEAMGEPFADSSAIPTYLVSEVARRSVTVALSGIGGDELFGGYPRYLGMRAAGRYAALPAGLRGWIAVRVAPHLPEGDGSRDQAGRLKRFFRNGDRPPADQYWRWMTFLPAEWEQSALTPEFAEQAGPPEDGQAYRALFEQWPSEEPADKAMGLDLQTYLPDDLLRMGDRLSMAHSLELRVPFCDHELLAFALTLPASARLGGWRLKAFMRRSLAGVLPAEILSRPKYGFQVPLARWLREDLREMVHDLLADDAIRRRGLVRCEYVRSLLSAHERGERNCADQIYALLVLELWLRNSEA
jgi:asparagine synthase (glutamine-hydrolysing)